LDTSSNKINPIDENSSSGGDSDSDSEDEDEELKCCSCIAMKTAPRLLIILASLEVIYLLYNTAYGLIFYSVARANQTGVDANGQLKLGATANKYNK